MVGHDILAWVKYGTTKVWFVDRYNLQLEVQLKLGLQVQLKLEKLEELPLL